MSAPRPLYWSIRRELWENRSIYVAPLAVAALALAGFVIGLVRLPGRMRAAAALSPLAQHQALAEPYSLVAYLVMATTFVVTLVYCIDAFQGERRDRSVLFWKSLPVSDTTTVLAKATVPLVILPLLTVIVTFVTHLVMLVLSSVALAANGMSAALPWREVSFLTLSGLMLYHMVAVHALWYAPIYGWLLLASAAARRAAFLLALVPPLAIGLVERIAFNTSYFAGLLTSRLTGGSATQMGSPGAVLDPTHTHLTPGAFLASPGLWIGLALAAGCLALAVRLRHRQGTA
jgi:ABC-2 type transport system permease protein